MQNPLQVRKRLRQQFHPERNADEEFRTDVPYHIEKEYIPSDPAEFYKDFGYLTHPRTGKEIEALTDYQYEIWNSKAKTTIVVKPQKTGVTTSCLLQDFQTAITTGRGRDVLIVGQTLGHAIEHIYTLKRLIVDSPKYRKYLITKSSEMFFKEEKTKMGAIFIKNPDDPFRPARIIAAPFLSHGLWSWKNVYRIHMSDTAASDVINDREVYEAAGTRLASTQGYWLIESPPHGVNNHYYTLYEEYKGNTDPNVNVIVVNIEDAIKHDVVTAEFIESERRRLKHNWAQFYGSSFLESQGNLFSIDAINRAVAKGAYYNPAEYREGSIKFIACDLGFVTSKFAITIGEWDRDNHLLRILHNEEIESPLFENAIDRIMQLRKQYGNVLNIAIDATSRQEFCTALKMRIGEDSYWYRIKQKMDECKQKGYSLEKRMVVVPIIFSTESKLRMCAHLQQLLDDSRSLIAIPPQFTNVISSLKGAVFDDRGMLDKVMSPFHDTLDSLMMLCTFIQFKEGGNL